MQADVTQSALYAPLATMIAAVIAASAALTTLLFTILNKRGEEFRTAQRNAISANLDSVGRAIHEVIALSNIQSKVVGKDTYPEKYQDAASAARRLKDKRLDVRYSLWGLDESFRTLAKLPDWVGHAKPSPDVTSRLLKQANDLGHQMDLAIRRAFAAGAPPSAWRRFRIASAVRKFKRTYLDYSDQRKTSKPA